MSADTKHAEKAYLARTGSSVWERTKPFSPPGTDTLAESAHLLHDFAAALLMLQPSPDDLILDLGAGGCWCSHLLGRLNRSAIAVDISLDMLRAGRSREGPVVPAVAGDMESLPFKSGVFQKAICLSAVHHVPEIGKAVREIARVLADDGVALFSEPGRGHVDAPVAAAAVRDYGVLEQDILVGPFMRECRLAGFEDVSVKPLSHVVPGFDLTFDQWDAWTKLATSARPRRALSKIAFGFAELFGLGKRGPLFEETLAVWMVRTLRQVVEHHPVVVARKQRAVAFSESTRWRASLQADGPEAALRGSTVPVRINATNIGSGTWRPTTRSGLGYVMLGVQLLDADGRMVARDYHRVALPGTAGPGDSVTFAFDCPVPSQPGAFRLKLDLVAEGVTWFETVGSTPLFRTMQVR
jgi:SAM-dependent methyltransferase